MAFASRPVDPVRTSKINEHENTFCELQGQAFALKDPVGLEVPLRATDCFRLCRRLSEGHELLFQERNPHFEILICKE